MAGFRFFNGTIALTYEEIYTFLVDGSIVSFAYSEERGIRLLL